MKNIFFFIIIILGLDERVLSGHLIIEPHDLNRVSGKRNQIDDSQYSMYVQMFETLQGNAPKSIKGCEKEELINSDLLKGCVLDKSPKMKSLLEAINNGFYKGAATSFCYECFHLCSKDLCSNLGEPGQRDTFTDGFKLDRYEIKKKTEPTTSMSVRSYRSSSDKFYKQSTTYSHSSSSSAKSSDSSHYTSGNCVADYMVLSASNTPLVIFESKSSEAKIKKGLAQLVSHGLALRDIKKVSHEIKLVLLTPTFWYSASLSPYEEKELDDNYLEEIIFEKFNVLVWQLGQGLFLYRKAYLAFLRNLRQHFELVKLVD